MIETASLILKKHWGHDTLHTSQERAIGSILKGNDTIVVMPTGGGKSICYQLPAVMCEGMAIVVSPLIALMEDQVKALCRRKIPARFINSSLPRELCMQYMQEALEGKLKMLYITPERIRSDSFIKDAEWLKVSFIAVDEAHCISSWGHDFRPSYRFISSLRKLFPSAPVMALTATATPAVVRDICMNLDFSSSCEKIYQSFRRDNLSYEVEHTTRRYHRLLELLGQNDGSVIIYCGSKSTIQELAGMLSANGVSATQYHAGLSAAVRSKALREWMCGEKRVMVATSAFGMGIDKADVRMVIHWHIPHSVEDYFQQAGRAGRDGYPARAIMLTDDKSFTTLDYLSDISPKAEDIMALYLRLCNYYGVGYGDSPAEAFRFSWDEFCDSYHITDRGYIRTLFSYLVRYGIVSFYGNETFMARAMIMCDVDECYNMNENSYTRILEALIRSSDGIFGYMTAVDVEKCASCADMTVQDFCNGMEKLKEMGMVNWIPAGRYSMLNFLLTRNDDSVRALINRSVRKSTELRREGTERIKEYINTDMCRARWIEAYFGMNEGVECGMCDNCKRQSER